MRTVICHFYNESYLLPWWLKHHIRLFDHGVMIDHGSTDDSADHVRQLAPHWRLVRSRLTHFDAYLTDFEVMGYEQEMPGWKMALNVTEFLMPTVPLEAIERQLNANGRTGCACSGIVIVDHDCATPPSADQPLPLQKHWGIDDNAVRVPAERTARGQTPQPMRNRFYHRNAVGMYHPGRHQSFHQDSHMRMMDLMVFHFGYAPWNEDTLRRKLQIKSKLKPEDVQRGWGAQHLKQADAWQQEYTTIRSAATDLLVHPYAQRAIQRCAA